MSGAQGQSFFLDTAGAGAWIPGPSRALGLRDYAPSVMYDTGKIIFIGGGNDPQTNLPTNGAETIDLTAEAPAWHATSAMHFRRRQHNATILADGTVLVTGGAQGPGFNDVNSGQPIHAAESRYGAAATRPGAWPRKRAGIGAPPAPRSLLKTVACSAPADDEYSPQR